VQDTPWQITVPTPLPGSWLPVATGAIAVLTAIVTVLPRVGWTRRAVFGLNVVGTVAHEAGHAAAGIITGGGVITIRVHTPHSGVTHSWHYSRISAVVVKFAGYATPPLAGYGAASLLARGHAPMVLALTVAVLGLVLVVSRGVVTVASVLAIGLLAWVAAAWSPLWVQHWVAYTETWLLLCSEITGVWFLVHNRIRGDVGSTDDAAGLARLTGVPGVVWIAAWTALIGWTLWHAVPLLWP